MEWRGQIMDNTIVFKNSDKLSNIFISSELTRQVSPKSKMFFPDNDYIYFVESGLVKIYVIDQKGFERFLWIIGPGSFIPTYSVSLLKRLCPLTNTTFRLIPKKNLVGYFAEDPYLFDDFMGQIYQRYDRNLISYIDRVNFPARVRFLELLYDVGTLSGKQKYNVSLKNYLTRQDMATYVGLHITNVSKMLQDFEAEQLIIREGRKIVIRDMDQIRQLLDEAYENQACFTIPK